MLNGRRIADADVLPRINRAVEYVMVTGSFADYLNARRFQMDKVQHLEEVVANLPPADLAKFRRWFAEFDAAAWDSQIESDAVAGKLDRLANEALDEYAAGKVREI